MQSIFYRLTDLISHYVTRMLLDLQPRVKNPWLSMIGRYATEQAKICDEPGLYGV